MYQLLDQDTQLTGFSWQDLSAAGGNVGELPGYSLGGGASGQLPPDLAVVVSWRTGIGGPSYRGRSYIGNLGYSVLDASKGTIAVPKALQLKQGADLFITELGATGTLLVIYSRMGLGGMSTVNDAKVDTHFDVQRRRGD